MNKFLENAKKIEVENSSVDFFEFEKDGLTYYYFDSSITTPPHPMVNAMLGLKLLDNPKKRLLMRNHQKPMGLFPKIKENFEYEILEEDEDILIEFKYKQGTTLNVDFNDSNCQG
ncbi:MAG: hypothetical protein ACNI25_12175 [Halarcobacter sp.]